MTRINPEQPRPNFLLLSIICVAVLSGCFLDSGSAKRVAGNQNDSNCKMFITALVNPTDTELRAICTDSEDFPVFQRSEFVTDSEGINGTFVYCCRK